MGEATETAAVVAAVASIISVALTLWFRWHPRTPGATWLLAPVGRGQIYELRNNTGAAALDVQLSGPPLLARTTRSYPLVEAGTAIYPVIGIAASDGAPNLEVQWSRRKGGPRRSFTQQVPPQPKVPV